MNLRTLTLPALAAGALVAGLTIGALSPDYPGIGTPTPSPAASAPFVLPEPFLSAVTCTEDEPCWNCETMGNRICGSLTEDLKRQGWAEWERSGGAGSLLVDTHANVTLTGYTWDDPYRGTPALAPNQLALPDAGRWFIFTATRP